MGMCMIIQSFLEICKVLIKAHDGFVFFDFKKLNIFFLFVIANAVKAANIKDTNNDMASRLSDLIPNGKV
jgi:hypothetical protein